MIVTSVFFHRGIYLPCKSLHRIVSKSVKVGARVRYRALPMKQFAKLHFPQQPNMADVSHNIAIISRVVYASFKAESFDG